MPDYLTDALVTAVRRQGGAFAAGAWTLRLPRIFGFCGGVLHALETLQRALTEAQALPVRPAFWLLGEIIHNESVNRHFREQGVTVLPENEIGSVFARVQPGDRVVIPAFGVPLEIAQRLQQAEAAGGIVVVDTTCRYVQRIWAFAAAAAGRGCTVLLHGKPGHPEIRGVVSRALRGSNAVVMLPDEAAVAALAAALEARQAVWPLGLTVYAPEQLRLDRFALVHQTTMMHDETVRIEACLRAAVTAGGGELVVMDTVCRATQERQQAALELCRQGCDLFLVIGGFASSNTNQLCRLAARSAPAYFIHDASDIERDVIRHFVPEDRQVRETRGWLPAGPRTIGVLAGASCPLPDIGGVLRRFAELAEARA